MKKLITYITSILMILCIVTAASPLCEAKVKKVSGWPKDIPLINGTITMSVKSKVFNSSTDKMTDNFAYTTVVETKKNIKDSLAFYTTKFSKVLNKASINSNSGNCTGLIGKWKVYVTSAVKANDKTGKYMLTLVVMKNNK